MDAQDVLNRKASSFQKKKVPIYQDDRGVLIELSGGSLVKKGCRTYYSPSQMRTPQYAGTFYGLKGALYKGPTIEFTCIATIIAFLFQISRMSEAEVHSKGSFCVCQNW